MDKHNTCRYSNAGITCHKQDTPHRQSYQLQAVQVQWQVRLHCLPGSTSPSSEVQQEPLEQWLWVEVSAV